jgi:acetyltransferase-like isoleucine patch superfamily enzyme
MNPLKVMYRYLSNKRYQKRLDKTFISVGKNAIMNFNSSYFSIKTIKLGDNVFIGNNAYLNADLVIGKNVMFGPNCSIIGGDHLFGVLGKSVRFLKPIGKENEKEIIIEDEVWCGASVIINKGLTIGMGSVIGAGSVVVRSIPPYTVAVGNPCKVKKIIFNDEELGRHLKLLHYDESYIKLIIDRRREMLLNSNIVL